MLPDLVFDLLLVVPLGLMAIVFLYIALQGIVKRRPIVFSSRLFTWPITLTFAALAVAMLSLQFSPSGGGFDFLIMLQVLMFVVLLFVIWRQMQGFFVLGVAEDAFRDALIAALNELGFSHKESVKGFSIDELDDTLQVTVQDWMGTAQLRMKSKANREHLGKLAGILKVRLASEPKGANMLSTIIFGIVGVLMVVFVVSILLDS